MFYTSFDKIGRFIKKMALKELKSAIMMAGGSYEWKNNELVVAANIMDNVHDVRILSTWLNDNDKIKLRVRLLDDSEDIVINGEDIEELHIPYITASFDMLGDVRIPGLQKKLDTEWDRM